MHIINFTTHFKPALFPRNWIIEPQIIQSNSTRNWTGNGFQTFKIELLALENKSRMEKTDSQQLIGAFDQIRDQILLVQAILKML